MIAMLSTRTLLPSGAIHRRTPEIPLGSVLALANRQPEAVVTIGRWRVVGVPADPPHHAAELQGNSLTTHQDLRTLPPLAPEERGSELPQLVWIDLEKPAGLRAELPDGAWERLQELIRQSTQQARELPYGGFLGVDEPSPGAGSLLLAGSPYHPIEPTPRVGVMVSAASWALLSQVFWIPLVAVDFHDRWVAHQRDVTPPGRPLPPSPIASVTPFGLSQLLAGSPPPLKGAGHTNQASAISGDMGRSFPGASGVTAAKGIPGSLLSSAGSSASSLLDRPFTTSIDTSSPGLPPLPPVLNRESRHSPAQPATNLLTRAFTRAQLLGGSISLSDLQEGPMSALAIAERALQRSSGDPLAPLPSLWREPMRQALQRLSTGSKTLSPARLVFVPSLAVSKPTEVPLALQSDGSVDVLEPPRDPAVLREIESWSRQQRPPGEGSLQPAIVHLQPLRDSSAITPATGSGPSNQGPSGSQSTKVRAADSSSHALPAAPGHDIPPPPAEAVSIPSQQPMLSEAATPVVPSAPDGLPPVAPAP